MPPKLRTTSNEVKDESKVEVENSTPVKKEETMKDLLGGELKAENQVPETGKAPKDWEHILGLIRELRALKDAPVDSMGCESVGNKEAEPDVFHFQVVRHFALRMFQLVGI
jgi:hypothetical protein